IGPDHILYPVLVGLALFPILMGDAGHHLADDMPDDETHPFFPDHFWPYPIIAVVMLIALGLLAAFVQKNLQLEPSADPRAVTIPRPDWYFLFLFQLLKLGPELFMALVIPPVVLGALILFPFIDSIAGPRMAKRLGWKSWPVPGRNIITGSIFGAHRTDLIVEPYVGLIQQRVELVTNRLDLELGSSVARDPHTVNCRQHLAL